MTLRAWRSREPRRPRSGCHSTRPSTAPDDVDVYWLGSLAPNWRLELKVVGGATQLALFRLGGVDPIPLPAAADPPYAYQVGGPQGGLSCADYYLRVSGNDGQYRWAWRLTRP